MKRRLSILSIYLVMRPVQPEHDSIAVRRVWRQNVRRLLSSPRTAMADVLQHIHGHGVWDFIVWDNAKDKKGAEAVANGDDGPATWPRAR